MPLSADLAAKSVHAAVAAIEIYNKPNFAYREESFAILMVNAWELLLKAKWVNMHGEDGTCLHVMVKDPKGGVIAKLNRSGNPQSHGLPYLAAKLLEHANSGFERGCHDNILALLEIRDNAAHFLNTDLSLARRVLEVGTASLRNYLCLATAWFQINFSSYNFFLMPLSFYHGFETAQAAIPVSHPDQIKKLLLYLDTLQQNDSDATATQHVALRLETKLVRGADPAAVSFRWTDDPTAPAVTVREEDILKNYPPTYRDLTDALKARYSDFMENDDYHNLRKKLQREKKFCFERAINPTKPKGQVQRFYNNNIIPEFDKHYTRRKKPGPSQQAKTAHSAG